MVRDGLFSFRCVCRLELERSGCVRRGPPAGAGAPPSGGRYGRARKGGPHRLDIGSKRVPPLGWARARSLPRALRARAPLLLDSAGCASIILLFTVSRAPTAHRRRTPRSTSALVQFHRQSFHFDTRGHRTGVHTHASGDTDVHGSTRHRRSTLRKPRHWSAPQSCSDPNLLGLEASTSHSHPHVVPALSAASAVSLQSRSPGLATRRPRPRPLRSHLVLSDLISDLIWSSQISSHPLSEVAGVGLELLLDALEIRLSLVRVDALL